MWISVDVIAALPTELSKRQIATTIFFFFSSKKKKEKNESIQDFFKI